METTLRELLKQLNDAVSEDPGVLDRPVIGMDGNYGIPDDFACYCQKVEDISGELMEESGLEPGQLCVTMWVG